MCLKKKLYFWKTKICIWMMFGLYKYVFIDLSAKKRRSEKSVKHIFWSYLSYLGSEPKTGYFAVFYMYSFDVSRKYVNKEPSTS